LGTVDLHDVSPQDLYEFLLLLTEGCAKSTARLRYAQLKAFFTFTIERTHVPLANPCNDSLLSKTFRAPRMKQREILGREVIDEIIYRCPTVRNRLILELQARCGLRIGEVLNLRVSDVNGRRLTLRRPKSGHEEESAFMPETVAARLKAYIEGQNLFSDDRLFPICYSTARSFVKRLGDAMKVKIRPHDLRRHSATYASRNGVPLEVISKVILRHQDLKTTQMYLGKISEVEALRWMDQLHGK
jgi:integrase/recombinase XerD